MTLYTGIARSHCQGVRAQKSLKHNIFSETLLAFFYNGLSRRQEKNSVRKKTHLAACTCVAAHTKSPPNSVKDCHSAHVQLVPALPRSRLSNTIPKKLFHYLSPLSPRVSHRFLRTLSPSRPEAVTRQGVVLTDLQSLIDCQ